MNEQDIIRLLFGLTDKRKFPYQLANSFIYSWECDFWTMTSSGETREFEIKISRNDFFADAKKEKHKLTDGANFFYYVCPKDMIGPEEIDKRYGLIYICESGSVELKRRPARLNANGFVDWRKLANKMYSKWYILWKQKWIDKEINLEEYRDGFNLQLLQSDTI